MPNEIVCENPTCIAGVGALCVLLRRLVYLSRLVDLERMFGRPKTALSMIMKEGTNYIHDSHGHLLSSSADVVIPCHVAELC